jgi:hypothetical protein
VIRIRPGRSWRHNPVYASELSGLDGRGARAFDGAHILDVVGIEVDGVDIAAGVGEARVLLAVDELLQALLRLGDGAAAAQATIGPGPTELVMEARGEDLLLTLSSFAPPSRLLASGLLVDAVKMRKAVLHAARGLLLDLLSFSPQLGAAQVSQRLSEASARLARQPLKPSPRWPRREAEARTIVSRAPPGHETLSVQLLPETTARILGRGEVPWAPLAAHLGAGSIALSRKGAPGLVAEGPIFLILRNLLEQAEELVDLHESGEEEHALRFGAHELTFNLRSGELRAPGWRAPARLGAIRFASLVAQAAQGYGRLSPSAELADELAGDLLERASRLSRHCRDLQSGDLRRSQAVVPAAPPSPPAGPLAARMRRLLYRPAFSVRVDTPRADPDDAGAAPARVITAGDALLVEARGRLEARDPATGAVVWSLAAAPGALARGPDLFFSEPGDALVRVEAATGEVRWRRRLRGAAHPARIWLLAKGVLRDLPGEGVALVDDSGTLRFRAKLPGGTPGEPLCVVETRDAIVVATSSIVAGLDPSDGALLWKRRARVRELVACGAQVLALEEAALSCMAAQSGKVLHRAAAPEGSHGLRALSDSALVVAPGAVLSFSLRDLAPGPQRELPWVSHLIAAHEPDSAVATGEGGAAARLDGRRWTVDPDGGPASPAQERRGVVLLSRRNNELYELESGLLLASLPPGEATLCEDLSCAILDGGTLTVHRLVTHLAVI